MKRLLIPLLTSTFVIGCATDRQGVGGTQSSSQIAVGGGDSSFASQACQAGAAEMQIGKLAARNTNNKQVRALAKTLSKDHAQAEKELAQIFARKNLPPEKELAPHLQDSLDRLASLTGREFDIAFKEQVIEDHEKTIELFEKQAQDGTDPDLKAFAQKHLSHLREHLAMAERLQVGADTQPDPTAADVLANPATRITGPAR